MDLYTKVRVCIFENKNMDLSQADWIDKKASTTDAVIIDVRSEEEFESGHIPDAELINIQNPPLFMERIGALDPSKTYFVYCRSGARSAQACMLMQQQGIPSVYNLLGGILDWEGPVI